MISNQAFKQGLASLLTVFPHLKPSDDENKEFVLRFWKRALETVCTSDVQFISAINNFILNTPKLYPTDNWLAMVIDSQKPKLSETLGDITELIFKVLGDVSFVYPNEQTKIALNNLKSKSPIAYAVGQRLGWKEMAMADNLGVLRGQIRTIAEEEIMRANKTGYVAPSANDVIENGELIPIISRTKLIQ